MPRVYELPTHLQVEDQLIAGLTARQLLRLMLGASLAYSVWDQADWLRDEVRLVFAVVVAVMGLLFAVLQPAGRPLHEWLLAVCLFVLLPRRLVWKPDITPQHRPLREPAGWADLEPRPTWLGQLADEDDAEARPAADARLRWRWGR